jgi:hypothetical protein
MSFDISYGQSIAPSANLNGVAKDLCTRVDGETAPIAVAMSWPGRSRTEFEKAYVS